MHLHTTGLPHWPYLWDRGAMHQQKFFEEFTALSDVYFAVSHVNASDLSVAYRTISTLDLAHQNQVRCHVNFMDTSHQALVPKEFSKFAGHWSTSHQIFTTAAAFVVRKSLEELVDAIKDHPALASIGIDNFKIQNKKQRLPNTSEYKKLLKYASTVLGIPSRAPLLLLSNADRAEVFATTYDGVKGLSDLVIKCDAAKSFVKEQNIVVYIGMPVNGTWLEHEERGYIEQLAIMQIKSMLGDNATVVRYGFANHTTDEYADTYAGVTPLNNDYYHWYNSLRGTR